MRDFETLVGNVETLAERVEKVLQYSLSAPRFSTLGSTIDLGSPAFK